MKITYSPEVAEARSVGQPIVALESTVIAHGLPYPENLQTAKKLESAIAAEGAVAATIAIVDGEIRVGLSEEELQTIARSEEVEKVSIRDLPLVVAKRRHGATTVASTMHIANAAGIGVQRAHAGEKH